LKKPRSDNDSNKDESSKGKSFHQHSATTKKHPKSATVENNSSSRSTNNWNEHRNAKTDADQVNDAQSAGLSLSLPNFNESGTFYNPNSKRLTSKSTITRKNSSNNSAKNGYEWYEHRNAKTDDDQTISAQSGFSLSVQSFAESESSLKKRKPHLKLKSTINKEDMHSSTNSMCKNYNSCKDSVNSSLLSSPGNSSSYTPRPVRIIQFDDTLGKGNGHYQQETASSKTKAGATITQTTISFMDSMRDISPNGNENNSDNSSRVDIIPAEHNSRTKSPYSSRSSRTGNTLPSHVDRKGRCLHHQEVQLFKKKRFGGYEMVLEHCPACMEDAPYYDSMCQERFKVNLRRGSSQSYLSDDKGEMRERSKSLERKGTARSRSKERPTPARSTEQQLGKPKPGSTSRVSHKPESDPCKGIARKDPPPPPPPRQPQDQLPLQQIPKGNSNSSHPSPQTHQHKSSRRGRSQSLDRRRSSSSGRMPHRSSENSLSVDKPSVDGSSTYLKAPPHRSRSMERGRSPSVSCGRSASSRRMPRRNSEDNLCDKALDAAGGSKSLIDKGIGKLSSLHQRARSSSQKRRASIQSGHEESRGNQQGVVCISDQGMKQSNHLKVKKNASANLTPRQIEFDKKTGRCKKHPSIILAKKSKFRKGAWDLVKDECPYCKGLNSSNSNNEVDNHFGEISKQKMNDLLGIKLPFPPPNESSNRGKMVSDKASSSSESEAFRHRSIPTDLNDQLPFDGKITRVSRMPYTTPWGESGWYTGEVDSLSRKPHGQGRMRCKTGNQIEGEWSNGHSLESLEKNGRIKSGFGTNIAPWKDDPRSSVGGSSRRSKSTTAPSLPVPVSPAASQYQGDHYPLTGSSQYGMATAAYGQPYQDATMMPTSGIWNQSPAPGGVYHYDSTAQNSGNAGHYMMQPSHSFHQASPLG